MGVVVTFSDVRAAVCAAGCCAFWFVGFFEVAEVSVGADGFTAVVHDPCDGVGVMTAFCDDHGGGVGAFSPMATDE